MVFPPTYLRFRYSDFQVAYMPSRHSPVFLVEQNSKLPTHQQQTAEAPAQDHDARASQTTAHASRSTVKINFESRCNLMPRGRPNARLHSRGVDIHAAMLPALVDMTPQYPNPCDPSCEQY